MNDVLIKIGSLLLLNAGHRLCVLPQCR